jgi:hypothetical protein
MLNTATSVSAYQLSRMLRDSPLTSKKTSPNRGRGAASDADMLPMVNPEPWLCPVSDHEKVLPAGIATFRGREFSRPAAKPSAGMASLIVG